MTHLYEAVLSHRPPTWDDMCSSDEVRCFELDEDDAEYTEVASKLDGILPTRIVRVQNPLLWGCYLLKRDEYVTRRGCTVEEDLWHATAKSKVDSILRTNFDWRRTKRCLYGKGVSFSPDPHYADKYCNEKNGCLRALLLCKVLVGVKCRGWPSMTVPKSNCDSTIRKNGKVIVKYMDNEFYPAYVAYYNHY